MPLNLTGNNNHNEINLTGKNDIKTNNTFKINNLKKYILTNYVIPLYSEQWSIINNNKLLIDETIKQVTIYYKLYKLDELHTFLELLKIIKIVMNKNDLLIDLENKNKRKLDKNNIISMIYKTTKIQILPEYEIYNSILGKPPVYNDQIIQDIKLLIIKETITYDKIKDFIIKKYQS
jgi:hypothetical protein